jgi:hypothetical protein
MYLDTYILHICTTMYTKYPNIINYNKLFCEHASKCVPKHEEPLSNTCLFLPKENVYSRRNNTNSCTIPLHVWICTATDSHACVCPHGKDEQNKDEEQEQQHVPFMVMQHAASRIACYLLLLPHDNDIVPWAILIAISRAAMTQDAEEQQGILIIAHRST